MGRIDLSTDIRAALGRRSVPRSLQRGFLMSPHHGRFPVPQNMTFTTGATSQYSLTESNRVATVYTTASASYYKFKYGSAKTSGKWYYEVKLDDHPGSGTAAWWYIGIAITGTAITTGIVGTANGGSGGRSQMLSTGQSRNLGTYYTYGSAYGTGDVIGCALDMDIKSVTMYVNGVSQGVMFTSSLLTNTTYEPHFAFLSNASNGGTMRSTLNFIYPPPAGYAAW